MSAREGEPMTPDLYEDELDAHIAESMKDPEYAAASRAVDERYARLLQRPCREGNCVEFYDPETGESNSGWGPVGCPCKDDEPRHRLARHCWLRLRRHTPGEERWGGVNTYARCTECGRAYVIATTDLGPI